MNELQIFNSEEFGEIRTVQLNDETYFIGKDVAIALGYERAAKAIQDHVDLDDKDEIPIQDSIGRMQNTPIINESGLYALIFGSKLESAKRFKHWVTSEVLPSIRKTGAYGVPKSTSGQIQLLAQGYTELEQAVTSIKDDVAELKDNTPLYGCEIDEIQHHVKRKVVEILGGKQSEAYRDRSVRGSVFQDMYRQLKREYGCVSSYKAIKRKWVSDAHDFIDCYELPRVLEEQVKETNAQLSMV